jgi:hypothetical protein
MAMKRLERVERLSSGLSYVGLLKGSGGNYTMRSLMICIPHPVLFGL